jgi:hypothetical protein
MTVATWIIALATTVQVPPPGGAQTRVAALRAEREALRTAEAEKLEGLAKRAGNEVESRAIRDAIEAPPPEKGPIRFVPLSEFVSAPATDKKDNLAYQKERQAIQSDTAKKLVALAAKAAAPGISKFDLADECLRAALARDSDQPEARRLLGYIRHEGGWATPHAVELVKAGKVLDPTFDWVPREWIPKLRQGLLPGKVFVNGQPTQWLPADQANALRAQGGILQGWQITTTPHFRIRTNVPLADAIDFGRRLEALHDAVFSLFADVIGPDRLPLALRYRNPKNKVSEKSYEVYYFATRDEYITHLNNEYGRDESRSLGVYLNPGMIPGSKAGRSFFFSDPGGQLPVTATLYHEVSHQLLFDWGGRSYEKNSGNYWVWEGLGTYFETLKPQADGSILLGALEGPRIDQARVRLLAHRQFVRIDEFCAMSKSLFNEERDERVYTHYAQAMALTIFLMHYEAGKYRDAFLDFVDDAYHGRIRPPGKRALENRLGVSSKVLDEAFLKWLKDAED